MQGSDVQDHGSPRRGAHRDSRKANAGAASRPDSPPPKEVRVGRLDSIAAIREELAKVYRATRKVVGARPNPSDATKLGWLLNAIAQTVIASELEGRIQALEARQKEGQP